MPTKKQNKEIDFKGSSCFGILVKSPKKDNLYFLANKYKIPDFQRGYVWKKAQIDRLIETIGAKRGKYLGNIVILSGSGGEDYIVDGQQRLVTISLLCKILEEKATGTVLKNNIKKLIIRDDDPRISFRDKILNGSFKNIILSGVPDKTKGSVSNNILEAIKYLQKNIFISNLDSDKKIKDFFIKIKDLQFVVIKCLNSREVYNLFEGLNSTGVALTSVEKTKNGLFGKLDELDNTASKSKLKQGKNIWANVEASFEKTYPFWFNKFLRHQWFLINGKVSDKKLYDDIRKIKITPAQNAKDILSYLNLIKSDADIYIRLRNGKLEEPWFPRNNRSNSSKDIVDVLKLFNNLDVEQIYPVLLALYKYADANKEYYKNSRFFEDIKRLWAFSLLAKYGKVVPSAYENIFAKLCLEIKGKSYTSFKKEMDSFFKELVSTITGVESKFIKNFNSQYNHGRDKLSKFIFSDLYGREKEIKNYEIEHILPRGKEGDGDFQKWPKISETKYSGLKEYLEKIGNLTLIEKNINRKVDNLSFENKIIEYKKSEFKDNKSIKSYVKFKSNTPHKGVENRGKDLSKKIFKVYKEISKK
ncbi:DUF262 domain-containing protein [Candidatus Parcubacteria bacterium]|jgi:uncharacterized protein with ParB-like and HNH nuclease domain|nr:DUF262 domain-containing protein [Candidatus Parcubacteria bacterium]